MPFKFHCLRSFLRLVINLNSDDFLNKFRFIALIFFLCLTFSACEKVIEFDLSKSEEAIVIEANLTNSKEPITVLLSKTSPYFGAKTDHTVSGAIVSIRAEGGKPKYLEETEPGVYKLDRIIASTGHWYIVDVEYEGIIYSSRSFMNEPVGIVDISFSYVDGLGFFDSGYKLICYLRDPGNIENYYRLKFYVNDKLIDDKGELSLYTDKLFDGNIIGLGQRAIVFQESDTLTIELQSIDKGAYNYFSTLETITGNEMLQSASPANPISNFNNGALGYFSAYSFDRKTVIIKNHIKKQSVP